ncbi:hypothetical protein F511_30225 [Dorcoceras hygrometricum]|uniref:Uncharacterized protein n=1 Tax=Dorcoceras hygrometricum TaxID=472368 RepID=A0A2Z7BUU5_9LAMI|nr:hypothetical protein F511_30225 [Dorcoceras hygrometricum]
MKSRARRKATHAAATSAAALRPWRRISSISVTQTAHKGQQLVGRRAQQFARTTSSSRPPLVRQERGHRASSARNSAHGPATVLEGGAYRRPNISAMIALDKASVARPARNNIRPIDPLGITDSACKNQLVVVSVQYGHFNPYIPIRSTTIGKSRVAIDPIAMRTSWRSNSDIASVTSIGYPRMSASGESSTTMHRLLHASGSHPIPPPDDPK